jgi:glucan phosphoethanolaminetransferase (alkaline phosphatase superfamily)
MIASSSNNNGTLRLISVRRLSYGALVGHLVTAGFIAIFGLVGVGISAAGIGIVKYFSWIAVLSGVIIIGIGIAKIFGKTFHINIPVPIGLVYGSSASNNRYNNNGNKHSGYTNFFLFGIGYVIASLSCTLPLSSCSLPRLICRRNCARLFCISLLCFRNGSCNDCSFTRNKCIKPNICKMVKETGPKNEYYNKYSLDSCGQLFHLL